MAGLQERERINADSRALLGTLDFWNEDYAKSLITARTLEECEAGRKDTLSAEQYFLPMFRPLYQQVSGFRETVLEELKPTGVSPEMIDLYFTNSGDLPGLVFTYKHGGEALGVSTLRRFFGAARECMFIQLRTVLCGNLPSPTA